MQYNFDKWKKRFINRSDITLTLTHLTRDQLNDNGNKLSSIDILVKILREKRIIGSSGKGFICGESNAVCFQDAPLYGIHQNIIHEKNYKEDLGAKIRYSHNGLIFLKKYVYKKGGRPVIYEKLEIAKSLLPRQEWWRIVSYNLDNNENIIDWTHEREWRIKGDFTFELNQVYVLLGNQADYKEFIEKAEFEILKSLAGITAMAPLN